MRLEEAQSTIREVHGKSYTWLKAWGLGWIGEAVRTIKARKSATERDRELAADVRRKLVRKW
jgi:hypothetical protein